MLRDIKITGVLNGWIVQVGCQQVVFDDMSTMFSELKRYLVDPEGTEERYRANAVNARHMSFEVEMLEEVTLETIPSS